MEGKGRKKTSSKLISCYTLDFPIASLSSWRAAAAAELSLLFRPLLISQSRRELVTPINCVDRRWHRYQSRPAYKWRQRLETETIGHVADARPPRTTSPPAAPDRPPRSRRTTM